MLESFAMAFTEEPDPTKRAEIAATMDRLGKRMADVSAFGAAIEAQYRGADAGDYIEMPDTINMGGITSGIQAPNGNNSPNWAFDLSKSAEGESAYNAWRGKAEETGLKNIRNRMRGYSDAAMQFVYSTFLADLDMYERTGSFPDNTEFKLPVGGNRGTKARSKFYPASDSPAWRGGQKERAEQRVSVSGSIPPAAPLDSEDQQFVDTRFPAIWDPERRQHVYQFNGAGQKKFGKQKFGVDPIKK
jgi:hypothetical protein